MRCSALRTSLISLPAAVIVFATMAVSPAPGQERSGEEYVWRRNASIEAGGFVSNRITALAYDGKRVLVGTDRGLAFTSSNGSDWQVEDLASAEPIWSNDGDLPSSDPASCNYVNCIEVTSRWSWAGTPAGLFLGEGNRWFRVGSKTGIPAGAIWRIASRGSVICIAGQAGVFRSDDSGRSWRPVPGLPAGKTFACLAVGDDAVWVAQRTLVREGGKGFSILRGKGSDGVWQEVWFGADVEANFPTITLNCIRAFEGQVWLGTSAGMFMSADGGSRWRRFTTTQRLPSGNTLDIIKVGRRVWVATDDGICYSQDDGDKWVADEYPRGRMNCLTADSRALWVGTDGGLLRRMAGGRYWASYSNASEITAVAVEKTERGSRWWIGTRGGLRASSDRGRTWRPYTVADGLPSNIVNGVAVDGKSVWVATDGGLARLGESGEYWRRYGVEEGLLSADVRGVAIADGTVWAATGRGLSRLDEGGEQFRTFRSLQGWEHVAFDGKILFAAGREWSEGDLAQYAASNIEPVRMPLYRFVGLDVNGGWENVFIDGYVGGDVRDVAIYDGCLWVVSDAGLFMSRDGGRSWAHFGSDCLWGPSVACLCRCADGGLMVQSTLGDMKGPYSVWSVTKDGGREWLTLKPRLPARVGAAAADGSSVIAGGPKGLYVLNKMVGSLLAPGRSGMFAFHQMALSAASYDGSGFRSVVGIDPYDFHAPTIWTGTQGQGLTAWHFPSGKVSFRAPAAPMKVSDAGETEGLVSDNVLSMAADPNEVYFGADMGVSKFERIMKWWYVPPGGDEKGLRGSQVRAIVRLGNEVWYGTETGCNVHDVESGRWRYFDSSSSPLPESGVTCLAAYPGYVWVGSNVGLFRYSPPADWQPVIKGAEVLCLAAGRNLLCAGTDRGFYLVDATGRVLERLDKDNSPLPSNRVERIILEGAEVWVSSGGAFLRLDLVSPVDGDRYDAIPSVRGPAGVLVVINNKSEDSVAVGLHYMKARHIPPENMCYINAPTDETISRDTYNEFVRRSVARHLLINRLSRRISFIVTTRGVPLRIAPSASTPDGEDSARTDRASVDSELALLGVDHPLEGPLSNGYLHRAEPFDSTKFGMYLVTRLDGPTAEDAMALVDRAILAEDSRALGSAGEAYLEYGGLNEEENQRAADAIRANYRALDAQSSIGGRAKLIARLAPNEAEKPDAFFYMGRPPAGAQRPEISWRAGAVAVALGPLSASSFGAKQAASWCRDAVAEGVTAAIGNCYNADPSSVTGMTNLYRYLSGGYYWAECAYMSLRYVSWQHVVLGDPLYRPYR